MEFKTTTMKFKTITAKNGGLLELEFAKWMKPGIELSQKSIHSDSRGNLVMAIFHEGEAVVLEPVPIVPEIPPEIMLVDEVLCPCCHTLTKPTTVEKGRWAGRKKCTSCQKTFLPKDAEPDIPTEGDTSSNTTVEPLKIGEVTNG